jgi:hypothetical protein
MSSPPTQRSKVSPSGKDNASYLPEYIHFTRLKYYDIFFRESAPGARYLVAHQTLQEIGHHLTDLNLDLILEDVEQVNTIGEEVLGPLLLKMTEALETENNLISISSPVTICGDIHGQLYDLFELVDRATDGQAIGSQKFLLMGNYVDRGYPDQFFLMPGNHECRQVDQMYGSYNECQVTYGHAGMWSLCNHVFDLLPWQH